MNPFNYKQAGAELGQAQVMLDDIVVIVVEVVVKAISKDEVQLLFLVGGGWVVGELSDKTKLILISTLVEAVGEVEVELGNENAQGYNQDLVNFSWSLQLIKHYYPRVRYGV